MKHTSIYNLQRLYATLLILGAGILLFRTVSMLSQGAVHVLVAWVFALLILEMIIDAACIVSSAAWWKTKNTRHAKIPLKLGAAAAIMHAFRVLLFLLGRTGPWTDFDVRPEQRIMHGERWSWGEVYFASIMSVLGVIGVIVIWQIRRRRKIALTPAERVSD